MRKSEDAYVDLLLAGVVNIGATLMHAHFPRAYLDVNREPYELDPALFAETLPDYANTHSLRVVGGLGTIARIVNEQEEIYRGPLSVSAALERINRLYKPYHAALSGLLTDARQRYRLCGIDRFPLHAVLSGRPGQCAEGRFRAGRPVRHVMCARHGAGDRAATFPGSATGWR